MIRIVVFLILFMAGSVLNAQTIETDRPDQTESASTVPKKSLQIEGGFLHELSEMNGIKELRVLVPTTLFRYGLTKGIELRLGTQYKSIRNRVTQETDDGFNDLELGAKVQLFKKESSTTQIAFSSHLLLPTGSKQFTNDKLGSINKLAISHALNKFIDLGYNVGYNYFGVGNGDFTYSLVLGISAFENFGVYIESYGLVIDFKTHVASFDSGITYLLKDNLQLDFSFGTGLNHDMDYLALGCSTNIDMKRKRKD